MLQNAKKSNKHPTVWVAYESGSNVANLELATILDRHIDLVPALNFLWLSIVCAIIHSARRTNSSEYHQDSPCPLDHPLIVLQLTCFPLTKSHVPRTVGYFPKDVSLSEHVARSIHTPTSSLFHVRVDVPASIQREVDGVEVHSNITSSLPLMLLINGVSPDDNCTVFNELQIPRITKNSWSILVQSAPETHKLFAVFCPL